MEYWNELEKKVSLINYKKIYELSHNDKDLIIDIIVHLIADIKLLDSLYEFGTIYEKNLLVNTKISKVTIELIDDDFFDFFFGRKTLIGKIEYNNETNTRLFRAICDSLIYHLKIKLKDVNS